MLNTAKLLVLASIGVVIGTASATAQSSGFPNSSSTSGGIPFNQSAGFTGSSLFSGSLGTSGGATGNLGGMIGQNTLQTFRNSFNGNTLSQSGFTGNGYRAASASSGNFGNTYGGFGTSMPSAFSAYYVNALAPGAPAVSALADFRSPIFGNGSFQGSYGGGGPSNSSYPTNTPTNPTYGQAAAGRILPYYTVAPAFDYRPSGPSSLQSDVAQVLTRSTALSPDRDIRVVLQGPAVVLRGTVANEHDRRLAADLVRLSPGVQEVRNELEVAGGAPP